MIEINQTGAIDDLHRTVGDVPTSNDAKRAEGKSIIEELAKLKYELQHNRQLTWVSLSVRCIANEG